MTQVLNSNNTPKAHIPKVAVAQLNSQLEPRENMLQISSLIEQAVDQRADLVVFPENFLCMGLSKLKDASRKFKVALYQLSRRAKEGNIAILCGSVPVSASQTESRYFSRSVLLGREGETLASYDKLHLFDVDVDDPYSSYRESDQFIRGKKPELVQFECLRLGMSICYDLRFPQLYQRYAMHGANVLTIPSAFTARTGEAHWEVLLRARAIETQCYVLAANQTGFHADGRQTWGHSMIIDPWGNVIAKVDQETGICCAELTLDTLNDIRKAMPMNKHQRTDIF
jgi:predicted amidohydrolase